MKETYIYTISDDKGKIRYIGKSNNIRNRLYKHLIEKNNLHKYNWLQSIIKRGNYPIIEVIDVVPVDEWSYWEMFWIDQFKQWGFKLVNLTIGGEGSEGYKHSDESKQRMRAAKLGKKLPEEHRREISNSIKLKSESDPNYNKCYDRSIDISRDLLYQKYIIENLSLNKIAALLNVSKKTVFSRLKENNITKGKYAWEKQCISNPCKVVLQLSKDGVVLNEWGSVKEASMSLGVNKGNLAACCRVLQRQQVVLFGNINNIYNNEIYKGGLSLKLDLGNKKLNYLSLGVILSLF